MSTPRHWVVAAALTAFAILAGGWFLVVSPRRADAATLREQRAAVDSSNATKNAQLTQLRAQAKGLPEQQAQLAAVLTRIPADPALPGLLRSLSAAADDAGVELIALAPAQPVAAAGPGAAPSAATGSLERIPVQATVRGGYFGVEQFVAALEDLPRAVLVDGFAVKPANLAITDAAVGSGTPLDATVTFSVFLAHRAADPVPPAPAPVG